MNIDFDRLFWQQRILERALDDMRSRHLGTFRELERLAAR